MVTNLSVRLEKHQTIEILLIVDFLRIFKNVAFPKKDRDLKFTSTLWLIGYNYLILFEHCRPNTVELDQSIFGN